jgi:hypothetical protein
MAAKRAVKEKPLEKMTATELREVAKEMPDIVGAHGLNKSELIAAIKEARGIVDDKPKKASRSVRQIKKKIKELRGQYDEALATDDKKMAPILRRKINRLKKKTRRAA